ncbi:hypothetical protein ACI5KX_08550 [Erythrobacter sp. GH1-10]|uniref:hypothetical protein n=1 Tax=Erythrobacter sp. GH1-10 TaxID=3349334 RepID=UPI003877E7DA
MSKAAKDGNGPGADETDRVRDVERILKDELARSDRALHGVPSVLTHLLASAGHSLVSDAIVARLRGMHSSLAVQLLNAKSGTSGGSPDSRDIDRLADHLAGDSVVLSYCYALAMEGHLAERLEQRCSLDPILSPLLQELIASPDAATGELGMGALAAQSRFIQSQRRMELPLAELPAELFHAVLKRWEVHERGDPELASAIKALKARYDEGASRVGLLARLVSSMRGGAIAALELEHAGLALFVAALSTLGKQPRELAILACHEQQAARLALSLRAAGLEQAAIERQFLLLEPTERLPGDIGEISPKRAAALLKNASSQDQG